jgi:hypothetical protein
MDVAAMSDLDQPTAKVRSARRAAPDRDLRRVERQKTVRSEAFGDFSTDIVVDGIVLHCHGGRDGERIMVQGDRGQHALRNVFALAEGLEPEAAFDRPEPSLTEVLAGWPNVIDALRSGRIAGYEARVGEVVVDRFNRMGVAG